MADAPPPYTENTGEKTGYHGGGGGFAQPPTSQAGYPPPQAGYPPPQAGYPPPSGPPPGGYQSQPGPYPPTSQGSSTTNTVFVTQPTMTIVQTFRESPVRTTCPHCRADIVTGTQYESGTFTWVICIIVFFFCWLGCCLIPFCVDGCKDVVHTCPNCRQQIARWSRM